MFREKLTTVRGAALVDNIAMSLSGGFEDGRVADCTDELAALQELLGGAVVAVRIGVDLIGQCTANDSAWLLGVTWLPAKKCTAV